MIENEIIKLQITGSLKLIVSGFLFFYWIPRKILPQDYIDNSLDGIMFNIIHMVAIINLIFPLFIYIKIFGFVFLVVFFIFVKLLFIKYYDKKDIQPYVKEKYIAYVLQILKFLENTQSFTTSVLAYSGSKIKKLRNHITPRTFFLLPNVLTIFLYGLYLRVYRGHVSLIAPLMDMYEFYLWDNLLKKNILFARAANPGYMWSGPVLVHTVNLLANLNTVFLYNIFPVLFLSLTFFSIYYFIKKLLSTDMEKTASMFVGLLVYCIILPSPLAHDFFGYSFTTVKPEVLHFSFLSFYPGSDILPIQKEGPYFPFLFFYRATTTLPYEVATSFFLINLYFFIKLIETKRNLYLLLYGESLAIIFSIHVGAAIPLVLPSLLIFSYSLLTFKLDRKVIFRGLLVISLATIIGNSWTLQFLVHGIPQEIGYAAPFLDKIFKTKRALKDISETSIFSVRLISSTFWLILLSILPAIFFVSGIFIKRLRFYLISAGLIILGVLFVYYATNLGVPELVNHQRSQNYIALCYAIGSSIIYYLIVEKSILKPFFRKIYFEISLSIVFVFSLISIIYVPRWIDTEYFRENIYAFEYNQFPYLLSRIEDNFQAYTTTVVSYPEQYHQISKTYHITMQDFLKEYDPSEEQLRIPTAYVFIFIENLPFYKPEAALYETKQFWKRWRRDIMLKLKDWVAIYSQSHDNIKLWYKDELVEVYLIDNTKYQDLLYKQRQELKDVER